MLQSKNGVYSVSDKTAIQTELNQLKKVFTRIASSTEFADQASSTLVAQANQRPSLALSLLSG